MKKIRVSGVGCCLVDRIYNRMNFQSQSFSHYLSQQPGDGGLVPGQLEFEEQFELFARKPFPQVLNDLTQGQEPDKVNIGGPCIVALIHAAQLCPDLADVQFYGCYSDDIVGQELLQALQQTPVQLNHYLLKPGYETASTTVFSDPHYDEGHGERIFVNTIGASGAFRPEDLDEAFFESDITVFGATALMPTIHEALHQLLPRAKQHHSLTVVNTVFDSLNERRHPDQRWPLGADDSTYQHIDLLITDREEALRLSGTDHTQQALQFFLQAGVGAVVITQGAKDVQVASQSALFGQPWQGSFPISAYVGEEMKKGSNGDTTGCGDNFAGGMIASLIQQLNQEQTVFDLAEACRWGVVSGGFACFYIGGTYHETQPLDKRNQLLPIYRAYCQQIGISE